MRNAVFAGTFDPITKGHEAVIEKASKMFDNLTVAICINPDKKALFSVKDRLEMLTAVCSEYKNVEVLYYEGMLVDLMKKKGAIYNVRGIRNSKDFEYENEMHYYNSNLYSDLVTVYLPCDKNLTEISSTMARKSVIDKNYDTTLLSQKVIDIIKRIDSKDNK